MAAGRNDRLADVLVNYIEGLRRNDALGAPAERNERLMRFIETLDPKDLVVGSSAVDEINRGGVAFALQAIGDAKDAVGDDLRALLATWERQDQEEQDRGDWANRQWGLRVDPSLRWRTPDGVDLGEGAHVLSSAPVVACGGAYDWLPAPERFTLRHVPSPVIRRWRRRRSRPEEPEVAQLAPTEDRARAGYCAPPQPLPAPPVRRLARRYRFDDRWGNASAPLAVSGWGDATIEGVALAATGVSMNVRCVTAVERSVQVRWLLPWARSGSDGVEGSLRECLVDLAADEADVELGPKAAASEWERRARALQREFTRSLELAGLMPRHAPAGWTFSPSPTVALADGDATIMPLNFTCPTPGRLALAVELCDREGDASAVSEVVVVRGGPSGVEVTYAAS